MRSLPSSPFQYLSFGEKFFVGLHQTANVFRRCQPNLVVGLGGYGALSACGYALHKGIPFVLLEANRVAGKVVRWFAPWSECVYSIAPVVGVDSKKIKAMGLPIRFSSCASLKNETKKTLLVMGGSQGAKAINDAMCGALPFLQPLQPQLDVIHLCGTETDKIAACYQRSGISHRVLPFYHKMEELYACADLIVCRAGGSTLAEITSFGLPSLLIPYAQAADHHQEINARFMQDAKAAILLPEKEGKSLASQILAFFEDDTKRQTMSFASKALGKPNAAFEIAQDLLRLIQAKSR